jgi:polyphosphate kinase 2 (PPK2 family)
MARAPRLKDIDLSPRVPEDERYEARLKELQLELLLAQNRMRDADATNGPRPSLCIVFEGMDAAGKGGAIRRLTGRLDPRGFRVHPIGPPTDAEQAHHWLWRFSCHMPARGEITIFDRSWYGRVLVERVEGFAKAREWKRAYGEIEAYEEMHDRAGTILLKFWLHISRKEQLRRFHEREQDKFKEYKIGPDDWRNRRRWDDYVEAADEMFEATHGKHAPWILVSGEDKQHARLEVLKATLHRLHEELGRKG